MPSTPLPAPATILLLASWQFVRALCITLSTEILRIRNAFACLARILWATAAATTATTKLTALARRCLISYVVYPPSGGEGEGRCGKVPQTILISLPWSQLLMSRRYIILHAAGHGLHACVCVRVSLWESVCMRECVCVCGVPKSNPCVKAAKCRIKHARMNTKHNLLRVRQILTAIVQEYIEII